MSPFERRCVVENGGSTPPKPAERRAILTWCETPYVRCIRLNLDSLIRLHANRP